MEPTPPMDPIAMLATLTVFGVVVKSVVDAIRKRYPVDGLWVQGLAWALGAALAWAFDLQGTEALLEYLGATAGRTPNVIVDYIITGAGIAAGAGLLAELAGRSGPRNAVAVVEVNADGERL